MILGKRKTILNMHKNTSICFFFRETGGAARKWTKTTTTTTTTPQRNSVVSDTGKSMEKLMCSYW